MRSGRFQFKWTRTDLIGAHVSTQGGVETIFERGREIDASALALFSRNSNQWNAKPLSEAVRVGFSRKRRAARIEPLIIHAAYLINLAATNEEFHRKSVDGMRLELERADQLGVHAVVVHPGAHMGEGVDAGIDKIARSLDAIHASLPDSQAITLLETSAGQGTSLCCTIEELGRIISLVDDPSRIGACVDTCHVFAAGYDIRTRDGWERLVDEIDRYVGIENVGAFHLNDSKRPLGARVDRHEQIGEGEIGLKPFGFVLNDPRFRYIPKVIETPKIEPIESDRRNLARLRSLVRD